MSSSSPFGGIRSFDLDNAAANATIDPWICRDYIVNNLLHCADQTAARVLVNDMVADDAYIVDNVQQYTTAAYTNVEWRPLARYGPFAISTRVVDGVIRPYRFRVAIAGASGSGGSAANFAIDVRPIPSWTTTGSYLTGVDGMGFAATTSTTPAWLTPNADLMQLSAAVVERRAYSVLHIVGGSPVTLETAEVVFTVMGYGAGEPRLYGCHIAEVFG